MPDHDSEILAEGQQVVTATAFIHRERNSCHEVFLPRRASTKRFLPGVYELPGGHIDFGEHVIDGLIREIKEEFGMEITVGDPFGVFDYRNEIKKSHSFEIVYFAKFLGDIANIKTDPSDHSEFAWVNLESLSDVYSEAKGAMDPEFQLVRRGFEILNGATYKTA